MTIIRLLVSIFMLSLTISVPCICSIPFSSNFNKLGLKQWEAYGSGTKIELTNDHERGKNVLVATFDDTSTAVWCNKGATVKFDKGISWKDFKYVYCQYKTSPSITSLGFLLHDSSGSWWLAFQARDLATGKWQFAGVQATQFKFGYNENPAITIGGKSAPIVEMIVYAGTTAVNTGTKYTFMLDDVVLGNSLPGRTENLDSQLSISKLFPLQWKNTSINKDGHMLVDGKPFFPLGLYSCFGIDQASGNFPICNYTGPTDDKTNRSRFKAIKDAGFNLLQTYTMNLYGQKVSGPSWDGSERQQFPEEDSETTHALYREGMLKFLDYAQSAGLKVMAGAYSSYSINKPLPLIEPENAWAGRKLVLRDNIAALKDHPAMLLWYLIDEPGSVNMPVEDITLAYRYIKNLDQKHPLYIASADSNGDVQYMKAVDIYAPDSYPLAFDKPLISEPEKLDITAKHQTSNPAKPYLWQIVQICQWIKDKPLPTAEQIRLMSLLALTRDVKGLMFYEHKNYPEKEPEQWKRIALAIHSLHTVIPDILASNIIEHKYRISDQRIQTIMRKINTKSGYHYQLIAVNPVQDSQLNPVDMGLIKFDLSKLQIPQNSVVTVLDEDGLGNLKLGSHRKLPIVKNGKSYLFVDGFGKWGAHVYRIGPR